MKTILNKRIVSLLLALVMVLSMLPASVFAEEDAHPTDGTEQLVTEPVEPTEPEAPTEAPTEGPTETPTKAPTKAPIAVYATEHTHVKGSDGCCTVCDAPIIAMVFGTSGQIYCVTLAEAFEACTGTLDVISMEANATLAESLTVADHRVAINLNGYTISGDGSITVDYTAEQDTAGFYISGNGGKIDVPVTVSANGSMEVYGEITFGRPLIVSGKMHFEGDDAKLGAVLVSDSAALTVKGDTSIDSLTIGEHAKVQLSGGTYNKISAPITAKVSDLLASGYIFETAEGKAIAPDTLLSGITSYPLNVILCRHTALNADGTCTFCGAPAEAKIGEKFFGSFTEATTYANANPGSTIVLQSNVSLPGTTAPEDWPYIAADTTLDLNGKELDMVFVGKPDYDEYYDVTGVTPGSLTVTGSGYVSNAITLYGGEVTVTSGEISQLEVRAYVPCTAAITGGEVGTLRTGDENDNATVNVSVSGGTVKSVSSSAGTITFNGHTEAAAGGTDPSWYVSSGKVILNDGTFNFTLRDCTGSLILNGGTFSKIELSLYGATTTLADLLGEGRAFYSEDGTVIKADELTTLTNVTVKAHEHPNFSDDGKCPECGAPCKHTTVDENGKCTGCGAQFAVSLQVGDSISYHNNFESAINAAPRNMSDPVTITLLTDSPAYDIWGSRNITLDLNGKHLLGDTVTVNEHCTLTLTGSFDKFDLPLIVNGDANGTGELDRTGILVINPTGGAGVVETINAKAASRVTVRGGTINNLYIQTTDTKELSYIDLAGGTYNNISFPNINGNITLTDLLAPNCAFRCDEDFSKYTAGDLIDYGFRLDAKTVIENLSVVPCEHTSVNEWKGYCGYCGKLYAAKITTADGTVRYLESLTTEDVDSAADGTVKLLQDVTAFIHVNDSCTIELNGRTMKWLSANYADEITVRGNGSVTNLFIGSENPETPHNTTLVLEKDSSGRAPTIGKLAVYNTAKTQLTCGTFNGIERADAAPNTPTRVADLLAEGYALTNAAGEVVNGYTNVIFGTVTVTEHTHEFTKNAEGLDECACGVACAHETIGEDGKCNNCHYQLLVAALTFEDGTGAKFDNLTDAWEAAISFPGSTLKLLCDLTLDDSAEYFLAESGSFTFDLNGKTLEAEAQGYIFQIAGTANVTIKNGSIYNTFYFSPGQTQFFYGNGSAVNIVGGTAVLENLELTGGEGGSDDNYVKPCPIALQSSGNLTVTGCTLHGTLLLWVFDSATTVQIASTTIYGGLDYILLEGEKDPALIRGLFAEGNLLLTDEGKYIDLTDDAYWTFVTQGTVSFAQFTYSDGATVTPHTHTYKNGFCTSCGAPCDHAGDDHSQKATYFKQAVCSVCGASYGALAEDTTAPTLSLTGDLAQKLIDDDTITFEKYFNREVTVTLTATDNSYDHAGFNAETDSVKLGYIVQCYQLPTTVLEDIYKSGGFTPMEGNTLTVPLHTYADAAPLMLYFCATDAAGNHTIIATEGFQFDTVAPVMEILSPASDILEDGKTYSYCAPEITLKVTDDRFDAENGLSVQFAAETLMTDADGNYIIVYKDGYNVQTVTATDEMGNKTSVTIRLYRSHSFHEDGTCANCGTKVEIVAQITKDGSSTYYDSLDAALTVAQADEYKGCTLKLLADATGTVKVSSGDFKINANGKTIEKLNVMKSAKLAVSNGTVTGTVITAKTATLTASNCIFKSKVTCNGNGEFLHSTFEDALNARGDQVNVDYCTLNGTLTFSGGGTLQAGKVSGLITVNNGAVLDCSGSDGVHGAVLVKSGGKMYVHSGMKFTGNITVEADAELTLYAGEFAKLVANSGSTLTIKPIESNTVTITTAEIGKADKATLPTSVTFYAGVTFGEITVNGQRPIDCLADGLGYWDNDHSEITDGRNPILSNVTVVAHAHDCVWNTATHEKLCGCGYVAATDTTAPVISGVTDGGVYYGGIQFSVSDENEFTVMIDGSVVSSPLNTFLIEPDNKAHVITATDVAGNTVSITVSVMMTYRVTLSRGEGYTIAGDPVAKYGQDYTFTVEIAEGYSKTADFMVDVNGRPMHSSSGSYTYDLVESELHITVFGVADITPPTVELTVGSSTFDSFAGNDTFTLFFKTAQTVTVNASDAGSGLKTIEYLLSETAFASADAVTGDWTALEPEDGTASFSIAPQQKAFIYVRATDESGNVQIIDSEGVVLYTDAEMRSSSVTYVMGSDAEPRFRVNLNGNRISAIYNGTQKLAESNDYTRYAYGDVKLNNRYLRTLAAGEYTIRVIFNPMGEGYVEHDGNDAPAELTIKLTVEKKAPTIDHTDYDGKTYDGKPIGNLTYNTDSDGAVTLEFKPTGADNTAYTTAAPKNVGTYTIRITVAESDAFQAASSTMTFEIYPREVTISGVAVADKVYDGTPDASITSTGIVSNAVSGDDVTVVTGKATFDDKNVGTGKTVTFSGFSLSGDAAKNYTLTAQPASVTADITAKEVTIVGASVAATKVYDGTTAAMITSTGAPSENFDGENLTVKIGTAAYDNKNVGTGKAVTFFGFSLSGDAAKNYNLTAQPASVTADITSKQITIVGASVAATKVYDGTTAAAVTSVGAPSENFDGESLTVKVGTAAYDNKNVGTDKTVTFSGFSLSGDAVKNYTLTAQPASVTADITAKEVTIVGASVAATKVYDGTTAATITSTGTPSENFDGENLTIKVGTAAYDDKNVGTGKTVTFSGFELDGKDAVNYKLTAQPADTTASITAKNLTIADLKISDKQYDGTNAAVIEGTPRLVGVVEGDTLRLVNGVPTFENVTVGTDIPIRFTAFTLDGDAETVANYTLTQPTGITASIAEYLSDGTEYSVNSNDWINTDFVVTANDGWQLSRTDTADGEWTDTLTASDETADGTLTFYVRNTSTGVISTVVTEHYKIDKTNPTGEVTLNERSAFQTVLNKITFGLFFNSKVNVKLTADDDASGIQSILYYKSDKLLDDDAVCALTDWTDDSDFDIPAEDMEQFVIYVRIEDNAGNVTYIGSDGVIFDTTAPEIIGVEDGKTYYVTKRVAVDDENLAAVTLNGEPVSEVFSLAGDTDAAYIIRAIDKAGNETEITVTMKPIRSITDAIAAITVESVKSSDAETIETVERQVLDIAEPFDDEESTAEEWQQLVEAAAKCKALEERIAAVAAEIERITESVNGYDIDKVTSDDKADIEQLIADIDALLNGDNLTEAEREALEALKETAKSLLDRIAEVAAEIDRITESVNGYDIDTVTSDDKAAIEQLIADIDALLDGDNLTDAEREALEALKAAAQTLLDRIAEVAAEITRITESVNGYDIDTVTSDDKAAIEQLITDIDALLNGNNLTEAEREALEALKAAAQTLLDRIAENLKPTEDVCKPFIDIDQNAWYHAGVHYMIENGMMNGVGNGRFAPDGTLTRAMLVTILYRQAGSPSVEGKTNPFTDAQKGYYADAVTWAYAHKITKGATETTFEPDAPATREQIATILYRREGEPEVKQDLSAFSDADQITGYARAAMQWAVAEKIIQGDGNRLNARGDATRAEIATMLMRYLSK